MKADIEIYTDGSGHVNGFGGWAAFICTPDRVLKDFRMGTASGTSVDRMEFTALLEGLQGAREMTAQLPQNQFPDWRPCILWFSDRENLLRSVKRIYARSNCLDLWARFEWYEKYIILEGQFMTEDLFKDFPAFREVDLQSSAGYQMIKAYMSNFPFSPNFKI